MFRSLFILLALALSGPAFAQQLPEPALCSLSGHVTVKNKPVQGALVVIKLPGQRQESVTTDKEGSYSYKGLPVGRYLVSILHPLYTIKSTETLLAGIYKEVDLIGQATVTDFEMIAGGVISGSAIDAAGRPAIGESVVWGEMNSDVASTSQGGRARIWTDDLGRFRIYGLPSGKYWIAVGNGDASIVDASTLEPFQKTYYPKSPTKEQASEIQVSSGEETDIGAITLLTALPTFKVSGRIINTDTKEPVPKFEFDLSGTTGLGESVQTSFKTDEKGNFSLKRIPDGEYKLVPFVGLVKGRNITFEPMALSIGGQDVTALVIPAHNALVYIEGRVQVEGREFRSSDCHLILREGTDLQSKDQATHGINLAANGVFRLSGLRQTQYTLVVMPGPSLKVKTAAVDNQPLPANFVFSVLSLDLTAGPKTIDVQLSAREQQPSSPPPPRRPRP
ncbi:MAG TPA: carboxypeptidase regulatory-like domain-containing protein [Pyrinomonadaceae bacterium]